MDWAERTVAGIVAFCVRRARLVLTTYAALVVAALFSTVNYLEINTDTRSMLSPDLPFQQRTIELESAFPHLLESIVIVLQSAVPDAADAVAGALVDELTGQPGISSAFAGSADPFFKTHGLLYEDPDALREALGQLDDSAELLAALRATPTAETLFGSLATIHGGRAASDPETAAALDSIYTQIASVLAAKAAGEPAALSWQKLLAGDASGRVTTRLVQVMPELDYSQLQPAETALASINSALDAAPAMVGEATAELVTARVTGEPVLMFEELEAVADGIGLSLGASMIAVIFLLIVCYHSIRRTVATLVAIVVALCLALGFASIALGPLNLVSIAFVVPLVGLGLDFAIHVTTRAAELEKAGAAPADAFVETGRGIALALGLSAFTTAAAFLSFVGTDFIGMGQVGVLGAVGVIIAFVISLTLVPALVTRGKTSAVTTERAPAGDAVASAASAKGWAGVRNALTALLALAAVGSLFLAPQVRFDTDPTNLRDVESPSMVALAGLMVDPEVAPYRISLVGSADDVAAFADEADGAGLAHSVVTLDRLVPEDQDEKLAIAAEAYPGIL
ncbi:MAG: MMPL family transporter, partial [Pseudomonadota bacterium]